MFVSILQSYHDFHFRIPVFESDDLDCVRRGIRNRNYDHYMFGQLLVAYSCLWMHNLFAKLLRLCSALALSLPQKITQKRQPIHRQQALNFQGSSLASRASTPLSVGFPLQPTLPNPYRHAKFNQDLCGGLSFIPFSYLLPQICEPYRSDSHSSAPHEVLLR